jgi:iron complex transport system ATP-binding protein
MLVSPPLLELENVTVVRGDRPALTNLTLRIGAGERVCILGPNGSGKSTFVKLLTRECYPFAGEGTRMAILGEERWNVADLRTMLGIVSPDLIAACTSSATALEVVLSGFFSSTRVFPHHDVLPEHVAAARDAMARLGIAHLESRSTGAMSSGEVKRTLIARALVHAPRALLFDEPGTALDFAARGELRRAMRELASTPLGLVLVTHDVSEIIPEIDRVILLREGRVFADGPRVAVLTEAALSELFGVAVKLVSHEDRLHAL